MSANPVYVAVDTADPDRARALIAALRGSVGGFKLGLQFWNANGPAGVAALRKDMGDAGLFLDLKLHDIPNTVAAAARSVEALGVDILTVHAAGGREMMSAARDALPGAAKVVGVTVLTSMSDDEMTDIGVSDKAAAQVDRLAGLARDSGLDGIVCSPLEVADRRAAWPDGLLVVPGIRPEGAALNDQKRVMPPRAAVEAGADILVIGRPITAADDPRAAAEAIRQSLS
ncbi:MAG: orotidine-5'-phosphate decarboxylase [Pacificimonas sp.]|jgi:orotidine-5'-phosphate decarboxylase|nr:orotidine-5'-phosphate decarboxylase [Pacificimonas sp.]